MESIYVSYEEEGEGDMTHENCSQVLCTSSLSTCVHPSTSLHLWDFMSVIVVFVGK